MEVDLIKQERRIYYHIHRLRIPYAFHESFYAEGMIALWQAFESYNPERGQLNAHLNATINFHFIDLIRKNKRESDARISVKEQLITEQTTGNRITQTNQLLLNQAGIDVADYSIWQNIKLLLSPKQWTWVYYYVIRNYKLKEIAEIEGVSVEAVKSWAKEARRKLRTNKELKAMIIKTIQEGDIA